MIWLTSCVFSVCFWQRRIEEPLLVKRGADYHAGDAHTRLNVYGNMYLTIQYYYRSLPDARKLDMDDIEFYYDGIRDVIKAETRPQD